jgi:hypothetical protein
MFGAPATDLSPVATEQGWLLRRNPAALKRAYVRKRDVQRNKIGNRRRRDMAGNDLRTCAPTADKEPCGFGWLKRPRPPWIFRPENIIRASEFKPEAVAFPDDRIARKTAAHFLCYFGCRKLSGDKPFQFGGPFVCPVVSHGLRLACDPEQSAPAKGLRRTPMSDRDAKRDIEHRVLQ